MQTEREGRMKDKEETDAIKESRQWWLRSREDRLWLTGGIMDNGFGEEMRLTKRKKRIWKKRKKGLR